MSQLTENGREHGGGVFPNQLTPTNLSIDPGFAPTSSGIPAVSYDYLDMNLGAVVGAEIAWGAQISWVDYFGEDMTIFADGINNLQLYKNSNVYNVSVIAPISAPTASTTTVLYNLRPIANDAQPGFGGEPNSWDYHNITRTGDDGTEYYLSTNPLVQPDNTFEEVVTDAWQSIDNATEDDTGFVSYDLYYYALDGGGRVGSFKLQDPGYIPDVNTGHIVHLRMKKRTYVSPASPSTWTVNVYQGDPQDGGTLIATKNYDTDDITGSFADYTWTLDASDVANITDYTNLYIHHYNGSSNDDTNFHILDYSQIYLELPSSGSTTVPAGTYNYVYTYVRSATGTESGPSPELSVTHPGSSCILLDDFVVSDDPDVDYINIYRTVIDGGAFTLVDTIPNATPDNLTDGWYIDCLDDDQLTGPNVSILDPTRKRSYRAWRPERVRFVAAYQNRVWGAGAILDEDYTAGSATFVNGSTTVTGTGTHWTSLLEGRYINKGGVPIVPRKQWGGPGSGINPGLVDPDDLDVAEPDQTYRIISVESETSLTIARAFAEDGATNSDYVIADSRNPFAVYYSAAGFPEDFSPSASLEITGETSSGITGLVSFRARLYVFTRDSIYAISGNDETNFVIDKVWDGIGCVAGHTIIADDRTGLIYFQGDNGFYAFDGANVRNVASLGVDDSGVARGIDRTINSIDWGNIHRGVGLWDADYDVIHFYNAIEDSENTSSLVYDVQAQNWGIDDNPPILSAARVYGKDSKELYLTGDAHGGLWQLNLGHSDGVLSGTVVATVSAASRSVLTFSGTSFDTTNGLDFCPAILLSPSGETEWFIIDSNTATSITPMKLLNVTPNTLYKVIVGPIDYLIESGWVDYGSRRKPKVLQQLEIGFTPTQSGKLYVSAGADSIPIVNVGSASITKREAIDRVEICENGHVVKTRIRSFVPGYPVQISGIEHVILFDNGPEEQ